MLTLRAFWASAALVLLIPIAALADCSAPSTIKDLQECWQNDWNEKKLDVVMKLYADNANLVRGDRTVINRAEIEAYWKGLISTTQFAISVVTPTEKGVWGYDLGGYQENITTKDNKQNQQKGAYLVVAEKVGGKWLILLQVFTVQPQPAVAPAVGMFGNLAPATRGPFTSFQRGPA
jgi:ketosteroid isomerase-like protein